MLLIVNADDLGASEQINNEIFALMESGLVTSASIIANAPAFEHAAERSRHFPSCSFGVHLNLTVFAPLDRCRCLDAVLDNKGQLSRESLKTGFSASLRDAYLRELTAQVRRAFDAGIPVSHFDSHQHIHTIPKLFPVVKSLQRSFRVRRVRSTINLLPSGQPMTTSRSVRKKLFRLALRHYYATRSPEGLGDFRDFHTALHSGRLPRYRCLELMVHPGTSNPRYNEEVDLLLSEWLRRLPPEVKLGSYHSL